MEVILREDVQDLGFKDELVNVKNGYGRNYLIPKGFAKLATSSAKKMLAEDLKQKAHKEQKIVKEANAKADVLKQLKIKIYAKTATSDKLFGSVTAINLAEALKKAGYDIERKFIDIQGDSIKRTGSYNAKIRLHREVIIDFAFEVIGRK